MTKVAKFKHKDQDVGFKKSKLAGENKLCNAKDVNPAFCFKYLTTNSKYNFDYFSDKNHKLKMFETLFEKLDYCASYSRLELINQRKETGFEALDFERLKFQANAEKNLFGPKFISIRFNQQRYRIIGAFSDVCPNVFHVIGFDFDYSAYNHGS